LGALGEVFNIFQLENLKGYENVNNPAADTSGIGNNPIVVNEM
jgi:hypothetical protein